MSSIDEALDSQSQLKSGLAAGVLTLSENQEILFTRYDKIILPADGYVFWVKTGTTFLAQGSLHFAANQDQREDELIGIDKVIFTSLRQINDFNEISAESIYIGEFGGFKFSFNAHKNFYEQAGIYHYMGDAIYPPMYSQILDSLIGFDLLEPVVSNSLPIWLSLNDKCDMYPSFLVDQNIRPPYAAVHIEPSQTRALQAAPFLNDTLSHSQLATDIVRVTVYGMRNAEALDFQDYLLAHSLDSDDFGVMNMPIFRDEKRTQSELGILAQKKTIEFQVSYYQSRAAEVARQLILTARVNFYLQD